MQRMKPCTLALALGFALAASAGSAAEPMHGGHDHAHHGHHAHHAPAVPAMPEAAIRLSDTVLTDQDGRQLRLASDVVGDKVVIVNFVYTSCTAVCPVVSHLFSQVQEKLGGLLDERVRLVTVTVDPARDTPSRLKAYSAQHGAREGWLWLTGSTANVTEALKGFGAYTASFENHPQVILVGDARSGKWTRYYGFEHPERLIAKTYDYLAVRNQANWVVAGKE